MQNGDLFFIGNAHTKPHTHIRTYAHTHNIHILLCITYIYKIHIFLSQPSISYDEELDPVAKKLDVVRLIAHGIALQQLHLFSSSWWSHHWLSEGLATLLGLEMIDKVCFYTFR